MPVYYEIVKVLMDERLREARHESVESGREQLECVGREGSSWSRLLGLGRDPAAATCAG